MMRLFLAPEDVWMFRDGRPFDAASSHRARSLFPPYPSVLQGVIRSHHLVVNNLNFNDRSKEMKDEIKKLVGNATDYKSLQMRGPFVATYKDSKLTRYFPRPADWFPVKGEEEKIHALTPQARNGTFTSGDDGEGKYFLPQIFFPPDDYKPGKKEWGEWLTYEDLKEYLKGNAVTPVASDKLFLRESRVGIQIKAGSRAVEQGMLYEAEFVRPLEDVGLYLEVNGYQGWKETGMIKIGGESHAARYRQLTEAVEWMELPQTIKGRFKVYFATPAYFKNGWQPSNWSQFLGVELKPVAVALKGYETIGGFDYAAHGDKPSRRYVPAGSVYHFDTADKEIKITAPFTEEMGQIGFGQVMIVAQR
jgi:CRISPR-associated protein Cmr3